MAMGMAEMLMKQMGIDPAAIMSQLHAFQQQHANMVNAMQAIYEGQQQIRAQLDRMETTLVSLQTVDGNTYEEMSPETYLSFEPQKEKAL